MRGTDHRHSLVTINPFRVSVSPSRHSFSYGLLANSSVPPFNHASTQGEWVGLNTCHLFTPCATLRVLGVGLWNNGHPNRLINAAMSTSHTNRDSNPGWISHSQHRVPHFRSNVLSFWSIVGQRQPRTVADWPRWRPRGCWPSLARHCRIRPLIFIEPKTMTYFAFAINGTSAQSLHEICYQINERITWSVS